MRASAAVQAASEALRQSAWRAQQKQQLAPVGGRVADTYFRIASLIPLLYAVYSVFVGSANGLRRFRIQASFDVGFSTMKTILLLALAFVWSVTGAFVGFVAAAVLILIVASRVMRLLACGRSSPQIHMPAKRVYFSMSRA